MVTVGAALLHALATDFPLKQFYLKVDSDAMIFPRALLRFLPHLHTLRVAKHLDLRPALRGSGAAFWASPLGERSMPRGGGLRGRGADRAAPAVGAGRDYEGEMLALERQAAAKRGEAAGSGRQAAGRLPAGCLNTTLNLDSDLNPKTF